MVFCQVAILSSYFSRCDLIGRPFLLALLVPRFEEITNVSLRRFGRSLATRSTEPVMAVRRASMPCTCLACQPCSVPSGKVTYHSTPPSGLPVRIARVPAGTLCLSSWYEISSNARLCSPFHVRSWSKLVAPTRDKRQPPHTAKRTPAALQLTGALCTATLCHNGDPAQPSLGGRTNSATLPTGRPGDLARCAVVRQPVTLQARDRTIQDLLQEFSREAPRARSGLAPFRRHRP